MGKKIHDLESFTASDVAAALARNDPDELALLAITVVLGSEDAVLAEAVAEGLCRHEDLNVRINALAALGHGARKFRSLDEARIKPLLEAALQSADEGLASAAQSAADEIHQFLGWNIRGHEYGKTMPLRGNDEPDTALP